MTIQTLKQTARTATPASTGEHMDNTKSVGSRRAISALIGTLFLLGFVTYGIGFGLVTSVIGTSDFLAALPARQIALVLGAFLMLLNSAVDVGKAILFFPILEPHGKRTALAYFATMIFEVVLLAIGALALLMLVPLAQPGVEVGMSRLLSSLLVQSNTMAYQIAQMSLGFGCLFLCSTLFQARLIPRPLAMWGLIGYLIHMAGAIAEIFGIHISLTLLIPGGLFELALGFWLIFKGFAPSAYSQQF